MTADMIQWMIDHPGGIIAADEAEAMATYSMESLCQCVDTLRGLDDTLCPLHRIDR